MATGLRFPVMQQQGARPSSEDDEAADMHGDDDEEDGQEGEEDVYWEEGEEEEEKVYEEVEEEEDMPMGPSAESSRVAAAASSSEGRIGSGRGAAEVRAVGSERHARHDHRAPGKSAESLPPRPGAGGEAQGTRAWIKTPHAGMAYGFFVLVNSALIGIDVQISVSLEEEGEVSAGLIAIWILQCFFMLIFVVELVLRMRADMGEHGCAKAFCTALRIPSFLFDFAICCISGLDLWIIKPHFLFTLGDPRPQLTTALRVFQLLRLGRVVWLARISSQLSLLVSGFALSLRAVAWVFAMLVLVMYSGALICCSTLGFSQKPELATAFGSVGSSFYTHFKMLTLEDWPYLLDWAMEESDLWAVYFIGYATLANFALVNLVIGLVLDGVVRLAREAEDTGEAFAVEAPPFLQRIKEIAKQEGFDSSLAWEQCWELMSKPKFQQLLDVYEISTQVDPDVLFSMLMVADGTKIPLDDLGTFLLQLRGSSERTHKVHVRCDMHHISKRILDRIELFERRTIKNHRTYVHQMEQGVAASLQGLPNADAPDGSGAAGSSTTGHDSLLLSEATGSLRAADDGSLAHAGAAGDACSNPRLQELVRLTTTKLRLLHNEIQQTEADLRISLEQEESLRFRLAHVDREVQTATQHPAVPVAVQTHDGADDDASACPMPHCGCVGGAGLLRPSDPGVIEDTGVSQGCC